MAPDTETATFRTARTIAATPDGVYAAFADPARLAAWWGPAGFHNEFESFEFRVGGTWRFVMVGPDGTRYANENEFVELVPGVRVVVRHLSAPHFRLTVAMTAMPDGTHLTWTQTFDDPAVAAAVRHVVVPSNEQNLDRLAAVLAAGH